MSLYQKAGNEVPNKEAINEGIMDKIGEMKDEFPALYSTAERHY